MLWQSGLFRENEAVAERVMDSIDLEREKGITIMAKNTAISVPRTSTSTSWTRRATPTSAARSSARLTLVDGVLLLVDAAEGPLPQTRFVLKKALEAGLPPIVVINKIDRSDARPDEVLDEIYDLFIDLDATEDQLDFPVLYTNARTGTATRDLKSPGTSLEPLFETILATVPAPRFDPATGLQFRGGHARLGRLRRPPRHRPHRERGRAPGRPGRRRAPRRLGGAGQGHRPLRLRGAQAHRDRRGQRRRPGGHRRDREHRDRRDGGRPRESGGPAPHPHRRADRLDALLVQRLALRRPGGQVRHLAPSSASASWRERRVNVGIRVEETDSPDTFRVSGRGELQLAILIEIMRREGYEMEVGKPRSSRDQEGGRSLEPMEHLVIDIPEEYIGAVTQKVGPRRGTHDQDGQSRHRPGAPGVPHPGPRPHRLPHRVPHRHPGHRPPQPPLRRLGRVAGRHRPPPERAPWSPTAAGARPPTPSTTSRSAA